MSVPTTICVPTDLGELAEAAFDYAIDLAGRLGSRVVVGHRPRHRRPGVTERVVPASST